MTEATSCCGMAGVFGHQAERQVMSTALVDSSWRPRLGTDGPMHRCASGYSCRSQAKRFGFGTLHHPVAAVLDP